MKDIKPAKQQKVSFGMPELKPCYIKPDIISDLKSVLYRSTNSIPYPSVLHFFTDDHRFSAIWNQKDAFLAYLHNWPGIQYIISPDFSVYISDPRPYQILNCYKKAVISELLQRNNYKVIPSLSWSDYNSYSYAFEGLPSESVYSFPFRKPDEKNHYFWEGLFYFIKQFSPLLLLIFCAPSNQHQFHKIFSFFSEKTQLKSNYIFLNL